MSRAQIQSEAVQAIRDNLKLKVLGLHIYMRTGKTKIIIDFLKTVKKKDPKILIAYPDNKIYDSWISEIEKWKYTNTNITFCNFSSLKKYCNEKYDIVILDEAQALSEFELEKASEIKDNCKLMLLPSGTFGSETQMRLGMYLGMSIVYEYNGEEAVAGNVVADYEIVIHYIDLDNKLLNQKTKNGELRTEKRAYDAYSYIMENARRSGQNTTFLALARNRISQNSVAKQTYVKKLLSNLKDKRVLVFNGLVKTAESLGIASYHTKSKSDKALLDFHSKKINALALVNTGKAGITYKDLDCVILNGFTHNAEELSQIIARAQLLDFHGKKAIIHILCLREDAEMKKLNKALQMVNPQKIKINV